MAILRFVGQARKDLPLATFPKAAPLCERGTNRAKLAKDSGAQLRSTGA
jgi:hypothetical protein